MDEYIREIIAEEQGLTACPVFAPYTYGHCDGDCANCEGNLEMIEFYENELKNSEIKN